MNYTDRFSNHVLTNHSSLSELITSYLVAKYPTVKINGLIRNPAKVPAKLSANSNITIFEANSSDKAAVTKALKGSQVCICGYLGDNSLMTEGQKLLIDACIEAGVQRYIAGDWSGDYRTIELGEVPMKDPMKIIYAYLQDNRLQEALSEVSTSSVAASLKRFLQMCLRTMHIPKSIILDLERWALILQQCQMLQHGLLRSQWTLVLMA